MRKYLRFLLAVLLLKAVDNSYGQLIVRAQLDGAQAGTVSTGKGTLIGVMSADFKTLTYQITYAGLSGPLTGSHFHSALSGGVVQGITFSDNTATGSWTNIPDSLVRNLLNNNIYVNLHTGSFSGGEIRGTLKPAQFSFNIKLDGAQAGTASTAKGTGYLTADTAGYSKLKYQVTIAGLSSAFTAAHFHAAPGGGILQAVTFTDSTASGTWSGFPDSVYLLLLKGKVYLNVHSATNSGGEIRGTLVPTGEFPFVASIDSVEAGTNTSAKGTGWAMLSSDLAHLRYSVTYAKLSSAFSGAHFHSSPSGSVVQAITFTGNTATGDWTTLSDANLLDLLKGNIYINIHSSNFSGGEIRGTLKRPDGGIFTGKLDGSQAGTASSAKGTAWFIYNSDITASLTHRITIAGLSSPLSGAHYHALPSGAILQAISFTDSTSSGSWTSLPDSILHLIVKNSLYVNIHSNNFSAGEIRSTVTFGSGVITGVEQVSQEIPASFQLDQNFPNPFNPSTSIGFDIMRTSHISLRVYNVLGQEIATLVDEIMAPGQYNVRFNAARLTSGVYFYKLSTESFTQTRKMVLLK